MMSITNYVRDVSCSNSMIMNAIHTVKRAITLVAAGIDPTEIVNTAQRGMHLDLHSTHGK